MASKFPKDPFNGREKVTFRVIDTHGQAIFYQDAIVGVNVGEVEVTVVVETYDVKVMSHSKELQKQLQDMHNQYVAVSESRDEFIQRAVENEQRAARLRAALVAAGIPEKLVQLIEMGS